MCKAPGAMCGPLYVCKSLHVLCLAHFVMIKVNPKEYHGIPDRGYRVLPLTSVILSAVVR